MARALSSSLAHSLACTRSMLSWEGWLEAKTERRGAIGGPRPSVGFFSSLLGELKARR